MKESRSREMGLGLFGENIQPYCKLGNETRFQESQDSLMRSLSYALHESAFVAGENLPANTPQHVV